MWKALIPVFKQAEIDLFHVSDKVSKISYNVYKVVYWAAFSKFCFKLTEQIHWSINLFSSYSFQFLLEVVAAYTAQTAVSVDNISISEYFPEYFFFVSFDQSSLTASLSDSFLFLWNVVSIGWWYIRSWTYSYPTTVISSGTLTLLSTSSSMIPMPYSRLCKTTACGIAILWLRYFCASSSP